MPAIKTGNQGHDTALFAAEVAHQLATPAGTSATAVRAADLAFLRACKASCLANNGGAGMEPYISGLIALGTGGT